MSQNNKIKTKTNQLNDQQQQAIQSLLQLDNNENILQHNLFDWQNGHKLTHDRQKYNKSMNFIQINKKINYKNMNNPQYFCDNNIDMNRMNSNNNNPENTSNYLKNRNQFHLHKFKRAQSLFNPIKISKNISSGQIAFVESEQPSLSSNMLCSNLLNISSNYNNHYKNNNFNNTNKQLKYLNNIINSNNNDIGNQYIKSGQFLNGQSVMIQVQSYEDENNRKDMEYMMNKTFNNNNMMNNNKYISNDQINQQPQNQNIFINLNNTNSNNNMNINMNSNNMNMNRLPTKLQKRTNSFSPNNKVRYTSTSTMLTKKHQQQQYSNNIIFNHNKHKSMQIIKNKYKNEVNLHKIIQRIQNNHKSNNNNSNNLSKLSTFYNNNKKNQIMNCTFNNNKIYNNNRSNSYQIFNNSNNNNNHNNNKDKILKIYQQQQYKKLKSLKIYDNVVNITDIHQTALQKQRQTNKNYQSKQLKSIFQRQVISPRKNKSRSRHVYSNEKEKKDSNAIFNIKKII